MSGLGDEVVTRCASCGYALTARRYAVPRDCPICRAPLDPESDSPPRDAAQTQMNQQPAQAATPDDAPAGASEAAPSNASDASEAESSSSPSTPGESDAREAQASSPPSFGEVTEMTPHAAVTSPLGSVTTPVRGPIARDDARESERGDAQGFARHTVSYTPLDAGELWSEFGGASAPRPEPAPFVARAPQSGAKAGAEAGPEGAPPPSQPAPSSPEPTPSFPQSSPLGLSGAARAQEEPGRADAQTPARGAFEAGVASSRGMSRYGDAYRAARVTVALGTVIKGLAALLGLLIGFGLFVAVD